MYDGIEFTEHLWLLRNAYDEGRHDLLSSVYAMLQPHELISLINQNLLQILLYGHEKLSSNSNTKIS